MACRGSFWKDAKDPVHIHLPARALLLDESGGVEANARLKKVFFSNVFF